MSRIIPASHTSTIVNKAHVAEPMSELERVFHEFLRREKNRRPSEPIYKIAAECLQNTQTTQDEAHRVVLKHNSLSPEILTYFLAAAHNSCTELVINYDLHMSLPGAGYRLLQDKILINTGETGIWGGGKAEGVVINDGKAGMLFGDCRNGGMAIALRKPQSYLEHRSGLVIRHWDISSALMQYMRNLTDICKSGEDALSKTYGNSPVKQIKNHIWDIWRGVQP